MCPSVRMSSVLFFLLSCDELKEGGFTAGTGRDEELSGRFSRD